MAIRIENPTTLHDPRPFAYSHIAHVSGDLVLLAGQGPNDIDGNIIGGDFADQVALAFGNLGKALEAAGLGFEHVARLRTFIVDHDQARLEILGAKVTEIWGDTPPVQTLLGVARLALPGMLFEVDATAVRP